MKATLTSRKHHYIVKTVSLLVMVALVVGMVGCDASGGGRYMVTGRVTDKAGEGLPGVLISTSPSFGIAETDDQGFWKLTDLQGIVTLTPTLGGVLAFSPYERQVSSEESDVDFQVLVTEELAEQIQQTSDGIGDLVEPLWQDEAEPTPEDLDDLIEQVGAFYNVESAELDGWFLSVRYVDGPDEMWEVIPYEDLSSGMELSLQKALGPLAMSISDASHVVEAGRAALLHPLAVRTEPHNGWQYQQHVVPLLLNEMHEMLEGIGFDVTQRIGTEADIDFYRTLGDYDFIFTYGHGSRTGTQTGEPAPRWKVLADPWYWYHANETRTIRVMTKPYGRFWVVTDRFFTTFTSFDGSLMMDWGCSGLQNVPHSQGSTAQAVVSSGAAAYVGWDNVKWGNVEGAVSLVGNLAGGMTLQTAIDAMPPEQQRDEGTYQGEHIVSYLGFYPPDAGSLRLVVTEEELVEFPDANLEAAIREAIGKPTGDIYPSDLKGLTSLDASNRGVADLTGLEHCTGLTWLYLGGNQLSDISPMAGLTNLEHLRLDYNGLADIAPVANLVDLTWLELRGNHISELWPLSNLTNLTYLHLGDNQLSKISHLEGLTNVTLLYLDQNQISDISALEGLTNLTGLDLYDNEIGDISALAYLTQLQSTQLNHNQISDIKPLVDNTGLGEGDHIDLRWNPLSEQSINEYIPELIARGVTVDY